MNKVKHWTGFFIALIMTFIVSYGMIKLGKEDINWTIDKIISIWGLLSLYLFGTVISLITNTYALLIVYGLIKQKNNSDG